MLFIKPHQLFETVPKILVKLCYEFEKHGLNFRKLKKISIQFLKKSGEIVG